ncbi:p21-activated protein kinase-interacting protein 1-like [Sycon ciliatum]|uniref:p21-activated protein kinase-interacting protein 1-like n=1 Tax=Sycon ciliatum TaxID=27933 RepID=UPI0020AB0152|eukprot:scpid81699/ scgid25089/ p21-activated protein kinase-interacting protein 1-like; PAK1-interacting protein 1-like
MEGDSGVVIGTYENSLVGINIVAEDGESLSTQLKFTNQCHVGHVLSVAAHSQFIASGGDDETIRLLDIRKGVELGTLIHHEGSLNKLVFHESAGTLFLVCASVDGTISIWKCAQWDCLHALTGHKGAVSSLDVHPSGRFLLSVGVDRTLMTWNLMTGRQAFITRLPKAATDVKFSPNGNCFYLVFGSKVDVYDTASVAVKCSLECESPISSLTWWSDDQLLTGHQDGKLILFTIGDKEATQRAVSEDAHKNRIKCVTCMKRAGGKRIAISACSDGLLVFWNVKKSKIVKLSSGEIPGRPICMTTF